MRSLTKGLVTAAVLGALYTGSGGAQDVGYVARIAEKRGKPVETTSLAEIWRSGPELRPAVRRQAPLWNRDILRLRDRIHIELLLQNPNLFTNAYLGSHRLSSVGSYEILRDTIATLSNLQLVVRQGVMVVEHARGELLVIASGIRTRILGTTVLFEVDSLADSGTVFLQRGRISFPDYRREEAGEGRAWRLRRGRPPQEITLTAHERERWRHEVEYATRSVWQSKPFWQGAGFLVPAAVIVGGGIACIAAGCLEDDGVDIPAPAPGTSSGGIGITIPP